jgi:hypothetical protein
MAAESRYTVVEALLTNANGVQIDVKSNIVEYTFFEHVTSPYVHGNFVIVDDMGLKDLMEIKGTELLEIKIRYNDATENEELTIDKLFYISRVEVTSFTNSGAEVLLIHIVEEFVFRNSFKQFSKSYDGTFESMMARILENNFQKQIEVRTSNTSAQGRRKVIVPYLTPLEAAMWLRDRATTRSGFPFILHSSLYNNNFILNDLENVINKTTRPRNADFPLEYNPAKGNLEVGEDIEALIRQVVSIKKVDGENTIKMAENGAIGSLYVNTDVASNQSSESHISVRNILDEMYVNGVLERNTYASFFDPLLQIDGRLMDDYNAVAVHTVESGKTYNNFLGYNDDNADLRMRCNVIKHIFDRNTIEVTMSGALFMIGQVTVGEKLRFIVRSNRTGEFTTVDNRMSGDYCILSVRTVLADGNSSALVNMCKVSDLPPGTAE